MEEISVKQNREEDFKTALKDFLNSNYAMFLICLLTIFGWVLDFPYVTMFLLLIFEILVFLLCKDSPKAFMLPVFSIPYMVTTVKYGAVAWIFLILYIAGFFIAFGSYILTQIIKYGKKVTKGKMFYFFLLALIGNLLGGIIGNFHFVSFIAVLLISLAVYLGYWFCLNFLDNAKEYFARVIMFLALTISLEIVIEFLTAEDILSAFENKIIFVGTGEINSAVTYIAVGICSCFYLASKSRYDYLYILLALFFDVIIFLTHSRIALFIGTIVFLVCFFLVARKSPNKKYLYIGFGVLILLAVIICAIFFDKLYSLFSYYIEKGFTGNGRESLWTWCWDKFKDYPIFGAGFIYEGVLPTLKDANLMGYNIIYAHNFVLHFLTCTGVVGLVLNAPFYIKKYIEVFKKFNPFKFFVLTFYVVAFVDAIFDPTPNVEPFFVVISAFLIALVERDNYIEAPSNSGDKPYFASGERGSNKSEISSNNNEQNKSNNSIDSQDNTINQNTAQDDPATKSNKNSKSNSSKKITNKSKTKAKNKN